MPGTAIKGNNLVDSLLDVVDELRGDLHASMGVRQWRVYTRRRTWSGGATGAGIPALVDTEITPSPLVSRDLRKELTAFGVDEGGLVKISEVSLTYTEPELTGGTLGRGVEWLYVLVEAHGQLTRERYFTLANAPEPDRINTIGWVLTVRPANVEEC